MMGNVKIFCFMLTILNASDAAVSFAAEQYKVIQVLPSKSGAGEAIISGGKNAGLKDGDLFLTKRLLHDGSVNPRAYGDVVTGSVKIIQTNDDSAVVTIMSNGSEEAARKQAKFNMIMAGDMVERQTVAIAPVTVIAPEMVLRYEEIFVDPKAMPSTFELSLEGRQKLKEVALAVGGMRLETLLVEGHTDFEGSAEANQIESLQRAMTVKQFLSSELGFGPDRLVAIGQGEDEPAEDGFVPGARDRNRRIVIRTIPTPN